MINLQDIFARDIIVVTGHYGSGKTNLAINLALDLAAQGEQVTLADLDIVNPYFRSADFRTQAAEHGIDFVVSEYANSNLDMPALSAALDAKIGRAGKLVIDVGGDDAGAYALGRYATRIQAASYAMVYVVNAHRYLTREPGEALDLLREIEAASRLQATHIVNNSNLSYETTATGVAQTVPYGMAVAQAAGVPLAATALRRDLYAQLADKTGYYGIDIYVKVPWDTNPGDM